MLNDTPARIYGTNWCCSTPSSKKGSGMSWHEREVTLSACQMGGRWDGKGKKQLGSWEEEKELWRWRRKRSWEVVWKADRQKLGLTLKIICSGCSWVNSFRNFGVFFFFSGTPRKKNFLKHLYLCTFIDNVSQPKFSGNLLMWIQ